MKVLVIGTVIYLCFCPLASSGPVFFSHPPRVDQGLEELVCAPDTVYMVTNKVKKMDLNGVLVGEYGYIYKSIPSLRYANLAYGSSPVRGVMMDEMNNLFTGIVGPTVHCSLENDGHSWYYKEVSCYVKMVLDKKWNGHEIVMTLIKYSDCEETFSHSFPLKRYSHNIVPKNPWVKNEI